MAFSAFPQVRRAPFMALPRAARRVHRPLLAAVLAHGLVLWAPRLAAQRASGEPVGRTAASPSPEPRKRSALHATRVTAAFAFDGALDDAVYASAEPYSQFVQMEPNEGAPATEKTQVWILYDNENLYVGARLYESVPGKRVASDMRRDAPNLYNNDHLAVIFDSFNDHRNGFGFATNRLGSLFDFTSTNEQPSSNWNTLWDARAKDFDGGWTVEIKVPFRSIRYRVGANDWGVNVRRAIRWKNELDFASPVPRSWGRKALNKVSDAAVLEGVTAPPQGLNLDIKPYALGSQTTNLTATPSYANRRDGAVGFDGKWAPLPQLVTDFTVHTDFAQVEDDEAQVNLTRFSLVFPEKRDFFLEGQDAFGFGGANTGMNNPQVPGSMSPQGNSANDNLAPILFYSRRIGLSGSDVVPVIGGMRALGRNGPWQVGAVSMRTDDAPDGTPSTTYSVLRINRDILSRSRVGLIATDRDPARGGSNRAIGADAQFNLRDDIALIGMAARTDAPGKVGDRTSARARFDWNGDRYGVNLERLHVGQGFDPGVGFLRRTAFNRSFGMLRFSPRPTSVKAIRKLTYQLGSDYITGTNGRVQSTDLRGTFALEMASSDLLTVEGSSSREVLTVPFTVARNVNVPVGTYRFAQGKLIYYLGTQRRVNGSLTLSRGQFYGGTLSEATWRGRVEFSPQLLAEPTLSYNHVDGPYGAGDNNLLGARLTYTVSPRMFLAALTQYQSKTQSVSTNVRFRWEYQPGSELFLVYSDGRTTDTPHTIPQIENRSIVVKVTKLFRW